MSDPREFDRQHLWHPYSNVTDPASTLVAKEAQGVWITTGDGLRVIDAMSSWWCMIHGHRNPEIVAAMHAQLDRMPHVMFGGFTHEPAVELGRRLIGMTPPGLQKIFYCDSGSVSIEVAMKMSLQYQLAIGEGRRTKFATIRSGYHGDTWNAMSVGDPVTGMHHLFRKALPIHYFAPQPPIRIHENWNDDPAQNGLGEVRDILEENGDEIAAFILEPIVQGAGGMYFYHWEYLNQLRRLCDEFGILLIFDEIATGFGRTGKLFATDFTDIEPDILCLGKAITGGHLSFAATLTNDRIASGIGQGEPSGTFMHGPTFMANPLACAAACASLDLLSGDAWQKAVAGIERRMTAELAPAAELANVADVRVLGAIGVIQTKQPVSTETALEAAAETGVFLRPFGTKLYCMPPYITSNEELSRICAAMVQLAEGG